MDPITGPTVHLPPDPEVAIHHFSFLSTRQYVDKLNLYSDIEALQSAPSPGSHSIPRAIAAGARDFTVRYLKMKGYRDGPEGLHYCVVSALYRYLIEAKLWERTRDGSR
jgi:hypothetical protein